MKVTGCARAKTFVGTSVPQNRASVYQHGPVSHRFACIRVAKCSKTLLDIILGLMEVIGCARAKTFVGTSVPRNRAWVYQNAPVSHRFGCNRVAKSSKTLPNIILGLMEVTGYARAKTFVGTSLPRNSALVHPNVPVSHRFACICVARCSKTLPNIILGLMEIIGCAGAKTFVGTSVPRNTALLYQNAPVSHRFACIRVARCSKTLQTSFW